MKSPFPGMDPYIEACDLWEDLHYHLIAGIDEAILKILPRGYFSDIASRRYTLVTSHPSLANTPGKPDFTVGNPPLDGSSRMKAFHVEEFKETFVEIFVVREKRIPVTCIEVLSPLNKRPKTKGWKLYARKRQAMLLGRANFIEIDLLRGGRKFPMLTPWPDSPYSLLVSRRASAPNCRVWPAHYRHRLPPILVPLLKPDPDLTLDLQPLIDGIYSLGRFDEQLDYTRSLTPVLSTDDAVWMREVLAGSLAIDSEARQIVINPGRFTFATASTADSPTFLQDAA